MRTTKKQRKWILARSILLKLHRWYDAGMVAGSPEEIVFDRLTEQVANLEQSTRRAMFRERERQAMRQLCGKRKNEPRIVRVPPLRYPAHFPTKELDYLIEARRRQVQ